MRESLRKLVSASKEMDRLRTARTEVTALSSSLASQKEKLDAAEKALGEATAAEKGFERTVHEATEALRKKSAHLDAARAALGRQRRELSLAKARLSDLTDASHHSAKAMAESKAAYERARQGLSDYNSSLKKLGQKSAEEKAALEALKATVLSTAKAYEEARLSHQTNSQALKESRQAIAAESSALKKARDSLFELKSAYRLARLELSEATKALDEHRKKADEAGGSVARLRQQSKEYEKTVAAETERLRRAEDAVRQYEKSLEAAGLDVKNLDAAEKKLGVTLDKQKLRLADLDRLKRLSTKSRELRSEAVSSFYQTLALGSSFIVPIKVAAEFEQAMVRVGAMASATSEELSLLSREARRLGAETIFSAREVAAAQNNLATAGFNPTEIMRVMPAMLGLADAGMSDLAVTADIAAAVLRGFSLDVSEMDRTADVLTAAFTASSSSLESLGETMKYVAPIAAAVGASLEETSAAAALLSNVGIKGSMAGTALRAIYNRLAAPPSEARKVLKEMGIEAKDAAGNLKPLPDLLTEITRALEGMGTAKRAEAIKKLAGEEAAADLTELLKQTRSGKFQAEIKRYELAPTLRQLGKTLTEIPDAEFQSLAQKHGIRLNRAMSRLGLAGSFGQIFSGHKGPEFEQKFKALTKDLKLSPRESDVRTSELDLSSKAAQGSLRKLQVSEIGFYGERKRKEELTEEISQALKKLPEAERLQHIEALFSKTRLGVRALALEFSKAGKNGDELLKSLDRVNSVDKTRTQLSGTALKAWDDFKGDIEETAIILGNAAIPMLKDFAAWLKPIAEGFTRWLEKNKELSKSIMQALGGLLALSAGVMAVKLSLSGLLSILGGGWKLFGTGLKVFDHLSDKTSRSRRSIASLRLAMGRLSEMAPRLGGKLLELINIKRIMSGFSLGARRLWSLIGGGWLRLLSLAGPLKTMFTGVIAGIRLLGTAILTTPFGWIIAGVTAVAGISYLVYRNWDRIKPKLESIWSAIKETFAKAWGWIKENLGWHPLVIIAKNWDKILDYFKALYAKIRPYIEKLLPFSDGRTALKTEKPELSRLDKNKNDSGSWFGSILDSRAEPAPQRASRVADVPRERLSNFSPNITVNAEIHVSSGSDAPKHVAEKIKSEIKAAFAKVEVHTLFDPAGVG